MQSDAKAPECNCHPTLESALQQKGKGATLAWEQGEKKASVYGAPTSAIHSYIGAGPTSRSKSFLKKKRKHHEELKRGTKVHRKAVGSSK